MADAKITIKGDASGLERALAVGQVALRDFAHSATSAIGTSMQEVTKQLADVTLSAGRVNFGQQREEVKAFEASTAHLAIASGRDIEQLRATVRATGIELGKRPNEVAAWAREVGQLSYDFTGAADSMKGMEGIAALTGRQANDYKGLAVELRNVGHVGGETTTEIGKLVAQANEMHTIGGPAAFAEQITALADTVSHFSISSVADFNKVTAAAGELGKGLSPAAAGRVQQGAFGAVAADPLRWERYLGHEITDQHGQVKDPAKVLEEIAAKTKRRYGKDARRVLMLNFGAETGAAMFNADFEHAAKAAGMGPAASPEEARKAYLQTDAGKREVAQSQLDVSASKLVDSSSALGKAADALQQFAAHNPLTATVVTGALGAGMSNFMTSFGSSLSKIVAGSKGEGGAVGGLNALSGGRLLPGAAALAAGYAVGTWADEKWGLSDKLSKQMNVGNEMEAEGKNIDFRGDLAKQKQDRLSRIASMEKNGLTHGMAVFRADHAEAGTAAAQAVASGFQRGGGVAMTPQELAQALAQALKNQPLQVSFPNGPQEVAEQARHSAAAGNMHHG